MKLSNTIKISSLIAFFCSILSVSLSFILTNSKFENILLIGALTFIFTLLVSVIFIYYYTKKRIDGIYKMMETLSIEKSSQEDIFNEVEYDVIDWASKRREELEKLKETERYRREFIGNLAHELKTPVFSVQGYILTLLEGGLEDDTINRKFLLKASKGVDRISSVIEDMDIITRIESGILELDIKPFNISQLIKNVFFELEEKVKEKNRSIIIENKGKEALLVSADRSKIAQVLYNLIINSIYYGNDNGETKVIVSSNKEIVSITIKDNGPGIDQEHLNRLFERFYRVEKSRDRNKGGSGIGLAIVKHIIEAHNEKITVESTLGEGTSFTFSLKKG